MKSRLQKAWDNVSACCTARLVTVVALTAALALWEQASGQVQPKHVGLGGGFDTPSPSPVRTQELVGLGRIVAGEILVQLKPGVRIDEFESQVKLPGMKVMGLIPRLNIIRVGVSDDVTYQDAFAEAGAAPCVAALGYNALVSPASGVTPPNDPYFQWQWHLSNSGQGQGWLPGADIDALAAWSVQLGSEEVVVAVIDSGIQLNHQEFSGRLVPGYDFVQEDAVPQDGFGHGTKVAGLIAANVNNAYGVAGVDRNCKLLPLRVLNKDGQGSVFDLIQALEWAVDHDATVVNMSLGFPVEFGLLEAALNAASDAGLVLMAAAGNTPGLAVADKIWPGASASTISVNGTRYDDTYSQLTSTGTAVDFSAPSVTYTVGFGGGIELDAIAGSSAAVAVTSGIVSLMLAENPGLSQNQVYEFLRVGAEDQVGLRSEDTPGWDHFHGHGRVNAFRSLLALRSLSPDGVLAASPPTLSLSDGGTWVVRIEAGPSHAGRPYVLLGSWSGADGVHAAGVDWPLTLDRYFWHGLTKPNTEPLLGNVGVLDADGKGMATLTVPPGQPAWMGGATLHHAVAIFDGSLPHPLAMPPLLVSEPVAVRFDMPATSVFEENFEQGATGWTFDNGGLGHWHLAPAGECGARTIMAAYTPGPESCTIPAGLPTGGVLRSPSFAMTGKWPFTVSATMRRASTASDVLKTEVRVVDETGVATVLPQVWANKLVAEGADGKLKRLEWEIPNSSKLMGRMVHLEFIATGDGSTPSPGWLVDDVSVTNAGENPPEQ